MSEGLLQKKCNSPFAFKLIRQALTYENELFPDLVSQ